MTVWPQILQLLSIALHNSELMAIAGITVKALEAGHLNAFVCVA